MEIDDIFNQYEGALKRQEEARQRENQRIAAQQIVARDAIGKCLREVIEPVLIEVREKMAARNYACTVEYQQRVENVDGEKLTWAIGIYLETPGGKGLHPTRTPKLLFMGDVRQHAFVVEADHGIIAVSPDRTQPIPISSVSKEFVGTHVRNFVSAVYQPPKI